jgi:hypothetical protein
MIIIIQSAVLAAVIFVGTATVVQPLIDKLKVWLDL